nr:hypothetical protein [Tanacetum cinerariifolium]
KAKVAWKDVCLAKEQDGLGIESWKKKKLTGMFGTVEWKAEKENGRAFSCLFVLENRIGESLLILILFSALS